MSTRYQFVDDSGETRLAGFLVPEPGGSSAFAVATVTLTDAQVKALPTVSESGDGAVLVAAQGAGTLIVPIFAALFSNAPGFDGYTNFHATARLDFTYGSAGTFSDDVLAPLTHDPLVFLLGGNFAVDMYQTTPAVTSGASTTGLDSAGVNAPLAMLLHNSAAGALTGGAAGNSLVVVTAYTVVTL